MDHKAPDSRTLAIAAVLAIIAGAIAWGLMIGRCDYDNDEVTRAHSVWLAAQGLRPYHDFFECHPPYFALLSPLARSFTDTAALLTALRLAATAGNVLFLAGLASVAAAVSAAGWPAAILGTAAVAFHPAVLGFLAEFRIDGWGYALAAWTIAWFLRTHRPWRHLGLGLGTTAAALFFCPKIAPLAPLVLILEQVLARAPWRRALTAFAAFAAGAVGAGCLFLVWLAVNHLDLGKVFTYLVSYHAAANQHSGFGHGLWQAVAQKPILSLSLLAAFTVWAADCIRRSTLPAAYPSAVALWLLAQILLISYPHKQYYAPWFLFASVFLAFLPPILGSFVRRGASVGVIALCVLSLAAAAAAARSCASSRSLKLMHEAFLRTINQVTEDGDYVLTLSFVHPILRRDTFYLWYTTLDPSYGSEEILARMPVSRDLVSPRRYREELEARPPALVVLPDALPRRQRDAVQAFMEQRGYLASRIAQVPVAVRPDRWARFAREGGAAVVPHPTPLQERPPSRRR